MDGKEGGDVAKPQGEDLPSLVSRLTELLGQAADLLVKQRHAALDNTGLINRAKQIYHWRRKRDGLLGAEMFADPAWDILLDLFIAGAEGRSISVSSACIAAAVPATTGLRYLGGMTQKGMIVRTSDPEDARRVFVSLSDDMWQQMSSYFSDLEASLRD